MQKITPLPQTRLQGNYKTKMTYQEQLQTIDWKELRKKILERDSNKCTQCQNKNLITKLVSLERKDLPDSTMWISLRNISFTEPNLPYYQSYKGCLGDSSKDNIRSVEMILGLSKKDYQFTFAKYYQKQQIEEGKDSSIEKICETVNMLELLDQLEGKSKDKGSSFTVEKFKTYEQQSIIGTVIYSKGLHVHHEYYQIGKLAWQYPKDALTTLCLICHENLHNDQEIDVLDENGNCISKFEYCKRCHGAGELPEFRHVESGICFRCNGAKYEELIQ